MQKETKSTTTLAKLNATHAEWMALSVSATPQEKNRVFALMDAQPKAYLSGSHKNGFGIIVNGMPLTANKMPLSEAVKMAKKRGVQTNFAWSAPKWIEIN
tara:strand:- start:1073 stop:1372 length:300 start_codon:yes stop_codon:yes gene_type:complete